MPNIILISGGFDPIHSGHIKLINDANKYGDVVVLLNSDAWLRNKKGKEFLSFDERKIIMQNIKGETILEVGCGNGRFTEILLKYDANVIAIDGSIAIEANKKNHHHRLQQKDSFAVDIQFDSNYPGREPT